MKKIKYNLTTIVVLALLVEGISVYVNLIAHPKSQPYLTAIIIIVNVLVIGVVLWLRENKKL